MLSEVFAIINEHITYGMFDGNFEMTKITFLIVL